MADIENLGLFGTSFAVIDVIRHQSDINDTVMYNSHITYMLKDWSVISDEEETHTITIVTDIWETSDEQCAYNTAKHLNNLYPVSSIVNVYDEELITIREIHLNALTHSMHYLPEMRDLDGSSLDLQHIEVSTVLQ